MRNPSPSRLPALALVLVLSGFCGAPGAPVLAQEPSEAPPPPPSPIDGSTPEAALASYMAAVNQADWSASAAHMHADALAEVKVVFTMLAKSDESEEVLGTFFGLEEVEQLEALSPQATFERFLGGMMALNPQALELMKTADVSILGSVPEGEVRHVVYRLSMQADGAAFSQVAVAPFKKQGDEWRALLTGDMQAMFAALQSRVGG